MRQCKCKQHEGDRWLDDAMFTKNIRKPDGIDTTCRVCKSKTTKRWREENKEARDLLKPLKQQYYKQYYEENKTTVLNAIKTRNKKRQERLASDPEYRLSVFKKRWLSYIKTRAKRKGIKCTITVDDLTVPVVCPVLSIPLVVCSRPYGQKGPTDDNAPTVDRIDPTLGYTPDNIVIVSWRANRLKNNASLSELKKLLDFYTQYF